jgi:hypothetical protein
MTQIKEGLEKQPSEDLISMIKVAGDSLLSFGELWGSIKKKGASEGFSETDLQEMLRPYLKQKMDSKKIWYLFHKEEQIERVQTQKRTKFSTNDDKKDTGQTNSDKEKAAEELRKKQEADKQQEEYEREMAKARETPPPPKEIDLNAVFESLPDDDSMTCWKIDRIAGNALKNKISSWQGNTNKIFRVWMQEVNAK